MILAGVSSKEAGSTSSDTFLGPYLTATSSSTTESSVQLVMPVKGTVSNLAVNISTPPGGGKVWLFTIRKGGNDTGLKCSMTGGGSNTSCTGSEKVEFAAGELLSLKIHPENTPANWTSIRWSVTVN